MDYDQDQTKRYEDIFSMPQRDARFLREGSTSWYLIPARMGGVLFWSFVFLC